MYHFFVFVLEHIYYIVYILTHKLYINYKEIWNKF